MSEEAKLRGNELFKKGEYAKAAEEYSRAIALAPGDHILYSNRSFALFQLQDYQGAARDAYQCIRLKKDWTKGYYRLGLAMCGLKLYTKALEAFSVGLSGEPGNKELRAAFEKTRAAAAEESMNTLTWHKHPVLGAAGEGPRHRCTHTMTPVGSRVVSYGGFGQGIYKDVCVIDAETLTLVKGPDGCSPSSFEPGPRASHSAVAYGDNVVVFGGYNGDQEYYNEVFLYNVARGEWVPCSERAIHNAPKARCGHAAVGFGHEMYVFGGMGPKEHYKDVSVFDMRTEQWVTGLSFKGEPPAPRNSHTMTVVGNKAYVFGGCCGAEKYFNDMHVLDLSSLTWSSVDPVVVTAVDDGGGNSGVVPEPRMGHAAVAVGHRVYVHGGLVIADRSYRADTWVFDTEAQRWVAPEVAGTVPTPRAGHAMCVIRGNKILSYGGDGGRSVGVLNETWVADTDLEVAQLRSELKVNEIERAKMGQLISKQRAELNEMRVTKTDK